MGILVSAFTGSSGLVGGVVLFASSLNDELRRLLTGLELYMAIAGVAVIAVSFLTLRKEVFFSVDAGQTEVKNVAEQPSPQTQAGQ